MPINKYSKIDVLYQIVKHLAYQDIVQFKDTDIYELLFIRKQLCRDYLDTSKEGLGKVDRNHLIDFLIYQQNTLKTIFGIVDIEVFENALDKDPNEKYINLYNVKL